MQEAENLAMHQAKPSEVSGLACRKFIRQEYSTYVVGLSCKPTLARQFSNHSKHKDLTFKPRSEGLPHKEQGADLFILFIVGASAN